MFFHFLQNGEIPASDLSSAEWGTRGCGLSPEVCSHADMHEYVAPSTASQFRLKGSSPFIPILPLERSGGRRDMAISLRHDEGYDKGRRTNRPLCYKRQLPADVGRHDADAGRDGQGREK